MWLFTNEKKLMFGGDTVITRFSLKRKFPVFIIALLVLET